MDSFQLKRLSDRSDESLIREIQRVAALIPAGVITLAEFSKHSRVHPDTLRSRLGSWQNALTAAGLAHRYNALRQNPRHKKLPSSNLSDGQLVEELRTVARHLNKACITQREFNANSVFSADAISRRFGSWRAALAKAGLAVAKLGKRYSDDECFENLLQVWVHYGRPPKHDEMKQPPSIVGPKAYIIRWGTWIRALEAFVNKVNSDDENPITDAATPVTEAKDNGSENDHAKHVRTVPAADKRDIKLGLRWKVMQRDRYRCVKCGASPATDLTCRLHVDHVVPFSRGGKTVLENLQVLCEACNLGKASRIEHNGNG